MQRHALKNGIVFFFVAAAISVFAPAVVRADLRSELDALLGAPPATSWTVAARVLELPSGNVRYSLRADQPMKPASNLKLATSAAALKSLGKDHVFETTLAMRGQDLVVIGDGDPAFADPRLAEERGEPPLAVFDRWADRLQARGVNSVGDLILDASIFDDRFVHESWPAEQLSRWYAAPVAGLNINDNCIEVTVKPSGRPGSPTWYGVHPPNDWCKIINRSKTAAKGTPTIGRPAVDETFILAGPCGHEGTLQSIAVSDPVMLFGASLKKHLESRGVRVTGDLKRERVRNADGSLPESLRVYDIYETPISDVLLRCNRDSQNLFAEALLKHLGLAADRTAGVATPMGSRAAGAIAVLSYLQSIGADTQDIVIVDGSGLSHDNRVTAQALTEILRDRFVSDARDVFLQSLSRPGEAGTFQRRVPTLADRLFVKTGTINGVRALSGYVRSADDRWLCFSLLINDIRSNSRQVKRVQDDFCRILTNAMEAPAATSPAQSTD